jgi:hypothetical protein
MATFSWVASIVLVLLVATALNVQGFVLKTSSLGTRQVSTVLFNKTPLVANGKRMEFEPGMSLLAVRNCAHADISSVPSKKI